MKTKPLEIVKLEKAQADPASVRTPRELMTASKITLEILLNGSFCSLASVSAWKKVLFCYLTWNTVTMVALSINEAIHLLQAKCNKVLVIEPVFVMFIFLVATMNTLVAWIFLPHEIAITRSARAFHSTTFFFEKQILISGLNTFILLPIFVSDAYSCTFPNPLIRVNDVLPMSLVLTTFAGFSVLAMPLQRVLPRLTNVFDCLYTYVLRYILGILVLASLIIIFSQITSFSSLFTFYVYCYFAQLAISISFKFYFIIQRIQSRNPDGKSRDVREGKEKHRLTRV